MSWLFFPLWSEEADDQLYSLIRFRSVVGFFVKIQQLLAADGKCLVVCGMGRGSAHECLEFVWPVPLLLCLDEARVHDVAKPFQGCVLQLHLKLCLYLLEADIFSLQILADPKSSSAQAAARPAVGLILAP